MTANRAPVDQDGRAALRRAVQAYRGAPLGARIHVRARSILADLPAAEREVPRAGTIVDLGCGHGLFANFLVEMSRVPSSTRGDPSSTPGDPSSTQGGPPGGSPERRVIGIDPDPRKIAVAKRTERDGLRFEQGDAITAALPPCDAVTIVDVLYLLHPGAQLHVLMTAATALRPGGRLIVYAQEERPADPRFWLGYAQEMVATGIGLTRSSAGLHYATRDEMRARMEGCGLLVEVLPLRGRPYTDAIYVGRK